MGPAGRGAALKTFVPARLEGSGRTEGKGGGEESGIGCESGRPRDDARVCAGTGKLTVEGLLGLCDGDDLGPAASHTSSEISRVSVKGKRKKAPKVLHVAQLRASSDTARPLPALRSADCLLDVLVLSPRRQGFPPAACAEWAVV